MKPKVKTPLVIVGQVGRNKFKAEVHPHARLIVCSSERFGGLLPNTGTEARARIIAKRLFMRHAPLTSLFGLWLFVEAQTCFGDVRLTKIKGFKGSMGCLSAKYNDLTPEETKKVQPFIQSLKDETKSPPLQIRTPTPSSMR